MAWNIKRLFALVPALTRLRCADSADRPQQTRYPALQPPSAPDPTPRRCSDLPKPFSAINRNPQYDRLLLCFYRY